MWRIDKINKKRKSAGWDNPVAEDQEPPETTSTQITSVESIKPEEGQIVLVKVDKSLHEEALVAIRDTIKNILDKAGHPDTPVVVMEPGIGIELANKRLQHADRHADEQRVAELGKRVENLQHALHLVAGNAIDALSEFDREDATRSIAFIQDRLEAVGLPQITASGEVV